MVGAGSGILVDQRPAVAGGAVAELPLVAQLVAVRIARARRVERDRDAVREQLDVGFRQRPLVGLPEPRRQLDRQRLAGLVEDLEGDVVRQLLAAAEHERRGLAALVRLDLDLALAPLVLTGRGERHRAEGGDERDLGVGGIEIAHRQPLGVGWHRKAQLGHVLIVRDPHGRSRIDDLEPVRGEVAAIAQAEGHGVEIGVVAGRAFDLQAEDPPPADRLALLGEGREQGLPAVVEGGTGADHALGEHRPGGQLLGTGLRATADGTAIGALAAEQPVAGLGVVGRAVDQVMVAAGVGVEHAQIQPVLDAVRHAQEDHLAVVGIAFGGRGLGAIGDRERRLLSRGRLRCSRARPEPASLAGRRGHAAKPAWAISWPLVVAAWLPERISFPIASVVFELDILKSNRAGRVLG